MCCMYSLHFLLPFACPQNPHPTSLTMQSLLPTLPTCTHHNKPSQSFPCVIIYRRFSMFVNMNTIVSTIRDKLRRIWTKPRPWLPCSCAGHCQHNPALSFHTVCFCALWHDTVSDTCRHIPKPTVHNYYWQLQWLSTTVQSVLCNH
jgi:hypothetical protein